MRPKPLYSTPDTSPLLLVTAGVLAVTIFLIDALTRLDAAVAVLYVVVVLLAANVLDRRGVLLVSAGCLALTILAYLIGHGLTMTTALGRCLMSLSAIAITTFLALKNQAASRGLLAQARLLDLTHDTVFVRDMNDVITFWNRGAENLYGWRSNEAVGSITHQLLQTILPVPLEEITAELLRTDRWEGELTHTRRDGTEVVVASRWSLQRDEHGRPSGVMETNNDISQRKETEQRLREAERELRLTIDTIPALAWHTRPDGAAAYLNKRWLDYTGLTLEDALGWQWLVAVHADDRAALADRWRTMLAAGVPGDAEARLRRYDGAYRCFLFRAEPFRDERGELVGWYGTNTDIEDRKRAEDALRRSEALLAETQELSHTGSIGFDSATGQVFWSAEGARILGYPPSTPPTPALLLQHVHPDDVWLAQRSIDRANRGEPDDEFDIRLVMPDGAVKYVHAVSHASRDAAGGRVLRALIDVTAAREAEAALSRAQAELAHVARITTLGELAASIAHEVNQPLAAIVTNGQACLRWLDRDVPHLVEARGAIERIVGDADRASEVIRRILALSKRADPQKTPLNLNDVVDEVILLVRRELSSHDVSLQLDLAPDLPMVLADRVQIQQVIINLLINAVQAMAPVTDRRRRLSIRSRLEPPGQVLLAVRDSGAGIDPDTRNRLFDTFFTTKPDGVGMGLSICRSIVEAHGGEIWAHPPHDGPGTTFEFALPTVQAQGS